MAVASALAVALVVGGSITGAVGIARDPRLSASEAALERLGARIDAAGVDLGALTERVAQVDAALSELRDLLAVADAQLSERSRELDIRADRSTRVVTVDPRADPAATPTSLVELRSPLRVVSRAIRANDALAIELLDQQSEARGQAAEARDLLASLRRAAYELDTEGRTVRAELAEAIRSAQTIAEATPEPALERKAADVVARAREHLHRIDVAHDELRQREADVVRESIRIQGRLDELEHGMREVRSTTRDLYADMKIAEDIVASFLDGWPGSFEDPIIALDGVLRVCPVDEPRAYSDNWHAPRWGGGFHLHQGIDIFAPTGTPIRAPFDGTAVSADNWLGGTAVKVYGESGYVYNAHLSERGQLGPVRAGDIIGYVGSTGNASGPHDHFEYHPGNGDAVNPFLFLNAVC
ncbi:MAG TPA: peptidoglycan DD-metalloendopeptidase family protein [Actinomycetota bacterium]|nr:peptidoglycan DD-metalloendopeptidase family protein [Actinomycetota bacterium]